MNEFLNDPGIGLMILRISVGGLMLFHGIAKCQPLGIDYILEMLDKRNVPRSIAYGVYFCELVIPAALILGYETRIAAAVFALNMLVSIWLGFSGKIFTRTPRGGWSIELNVLYLTGALTLIFTGGGHYTIGN